MQTLCVFVLPRNFSVQVATNWTQISNIYISLNNILATVNVKNWNIANFS